MHLLICDASHHIIYSSFSALDPHPGNILVIEEEDGKQATRLGLIDYGCVLGVLGIPIDHFYDFTFIFAHPLLFMPFVSNPIYQAMQTLEAR